MFRWLFGRKRSPDSAPAPSPDDRFTRAIDDAIRQAAPLDAEKAQTLADDLGDGFTARAIAARAVKLGVPYIRKDLAARKAAPSTPNKQQPKARSTRPTARVNATSAAPKARLTEPTVYLGVYCTALRYDEDEHGASLPPDFEKAKREWKLSHNDVQNPHYRSACKLLSKWYVTEFSPVDTVMSFSLEVDTSGQARRGRDKHLSPGQSIRSAFATEPKLISSEVVGVDFREEPQSGPYSKGERVFRSPDVAVLAIYEARLNSKFGSADKLPQWLNLNAQFVSQCFSIGPKPGLLVSTEIDEDGEETTFSSSSWEGGEILLASATGTRDGAREKLVQRVTHERAALFETDIEQSPLHRMIYSADVDALRQQLEGGLDVAMTIDGEPLLKSALLALFVADTTFSDEENEQDLRACFPSLAAYKDALRRVTSLLLDAGADVNQPAGEHSIATVAEILNDPEVTPLIRARGDGQGNELALVLAAEAGDVERVRDLLAQGSEVDSDLAGGDTPLIMAAQGPGGEDGPALSGKQRSDQEATVKLLLEHGADVNAVSHDGNTALGNAVRRRNTTIAKILLDAGAKATGALPGGESITKLAGRVRDEK